MPTTAETAAGTPPTPGLLADRVVVVAGGGTGLGRALALGLSDQGAAVAVVGPSGEEAAVADELLGAGRAAVSATAELATRVQARAAFAVADALGPTDLIVHALVDPAALRSTPLADIDATTWDRRAEAPLRTALACTQAAFDRLRDRGGRLVFVTPTVALTGAAGLAPYVTALEGIRALAKSAARSGEGTASP